MTALQQGGRLTTFLGSGLGTSRPGCDPIAISLTHVHTAVMATALVQNGAKVIIASRKEKALKEVADNLNKHGSGTCDYVVADLSSKAGCDKLAAEVAKKTDKVHILVNNSGVTWGARFAEVPEREGWDKVFGQSIISCQHALLC